MENKTKKYNRIGLLGVTMMAFVIGVVFMIKEGVFDRSNTYYLVVDESLGVNSKTAITINGFKIGEVSRVKQFGTDMLIVLSIDPSIKLGAATEFVSKQKSIMGQREIYLEKVGAGMEYSDGDTIQRMLMVEPTVDLIDTTIIKQIEPTLKKLSRTFGKVLQEYGESE